MISLMDANCKVIAGRATFRSPWRRTMDRRDSPRARANRTYSDSITPIIFSLVCRAMFATPVMLRVSAGRMAWYSRSARVMLPASTPMGTDNPTGSQPSQTEKTISSRSASQNAGVLEISRQ